MLEEVVCFNAILVIIYWCVFFFFLEKSTGFVKIHSVRNVFII